MGKGRNAFCSKVRVAIRCWTRADPEDFHRDGVSLGLWPGMRVVWVPSGTEGLLAWEPSLRNGGEGLRSF
jgi:hypothetical protein